MAFRIPLHRNHHQKPQRIFVGQIDLRKWLCADCGALLRRKAPASKFVRQSMARWWMLLIEVSLPGIIVPLGTNRNFMHHKGKSLNMTIDLLLVSSPPKMGSSLMIPVLLSLLIHNMWTNFTLIDIPTHWTEENTA